jgi:hypothetical protein
VQLLLLLLLWVHLCLLLVLMLCCCQQLLLWVTKFPKTKPSDPQPHLYRSSRPLLLLPCLPLLLLI